MNQYFENGAAEKISAGWSGWSRWRKRPALPFSILNCLRRALRGSPFSIMLIALAIIMFASCDLLEPEIYTLTTTVNPEGAGTVSRSPDKDKYKDGETVTLTATANAGYTFDGWYDSGVEKLSGNASFDVTMDADRYFTAQFTVVSNPEAPVFTAFSFAGQSGTAVIDAANRTVKATAECGTDITALKPTFTLSPEGATAKIGTTAQTSGTSVVDFSTQATYVLATADGQATANWTVTITLPENCPTPEAPAFTDFSFEGQEGVAVIDAENRTVTALAECGTDITALKPTFTLSPAGTTAKVDGAVQTSATSVVDFSEPVTYTLATADGQATANWTVTVTLPENCQPTDCQTELTTEMVRDGGTLPKCTYTVTGSLSVNSGKTLTFSPGTVVMFDSESGNIRGLTASIVAKGTEAEPIIFTSAKENKAAGDWGGLQFENCDFEWCTFEYGGIYRNDTGTEMVLTYRNGTSSFKHCTWRESNYTGLHINGMITAFEYNTITNCGEMDDEFAYPMAVFPHTVERISSIKKLEVMGAGNVINTAKGVFIGNMVYGTETLHKLNCPYLRTVNGLSVGDVTNNNAKLTIEPGVQIIFRGVQRFEVSYGSTLIAQGTEDDPIVITSSTGSAGSWEGILFAANRGAGCILEHCRISGGGTGNSERRGNIRIISDSNSPSPTVTVRNCYIANSSAWGIGIDDCDHASYSQSGNTYENCALGDHPCN